MRIIYQSNLSIISALFISVLMSCVTPEAVVEDEKLSEQPDWLAKVPFEENYYYGIGLSNDLNRAKQKSIINIGQQFSTKVKSAITDNVKNENGNISSIVTKIDEQITDHVVSGAKFVDQFHDDDGNHWVLARAPLTCMLDVTEGLLLSYQLDLKQNDIIISKIVQEVEEKAENNISELLASNPRIVFSDDFNRPDSQSLSNNWIKQRSNDGLSKFVIKDNALYAPAQETHGIRITNKIGSLDSFVFSGSFKRDSLFDGESTGAFFMNGSSSSISQDQESWPKGGLYWSYISDSSWGYELFNKNYECVILGSGDMGGDDEVAVKWIPDPDKLYSFEWRAGSMTERDENTMELFIWETGSQRPNDPLIVYSDELISTGDNMILWGVHDNHEYFWDDIIIESIE